MSRDEIAMQAPVTFDMVASVYGKDVNLNDEAARRGFFAVWVLMRLEFADEMIRQCHPRKERQPPPAPPPCY